MWLAKPLEVFAITLLVFLQGGGMLVPVHAMASPGGGAAAWAPAPPGERGPGTIARQPGSERAASRVAADAPLSIGERRARAVAMTVFSLGAVIGASFLVGYLIKRLL